MYYFLVYWLSSFCLGKGSDLVSFVHLISPQQGVAWSKYSIESWTNDYLMRHNYHRQSVGLYRKSIKFHKCLEEIYNGRAGIIDNLWAPISQYSETSNPARLFLTGLWICAWWHRPEAPTTLETEEENPKFKDCPHNLTRHYLKVKSKKDNLSVWLHWSVLASHGWGPIHRIEKKSTTT